jgi:hypothetical protein
MPMYAAGALSVFSDLFGFRVGLKTHMLSRPAADVITTAALAAVDSQVITIATASGCPIPELEGNAILVCGAAVIVEDLATFGIGTRKNYLRSRH